MSEKTLSEKWYVIRQDTHGTEYLMRTKSDENEAKKIAETHDAQDHHQSYWVTQKLPENIIR